MLAYFGKEAKQEAVIPRISLETLEDMVGHNSPTGQLLQGTDL
jgi:hypothetical protein